METSVLWRRQDEPGHDAARLSRSEMGWRLQGATVFRSMNGPACLEYAVDLLPDWTTRRGQVQGFIAGRVINHEITRGDNGWSLDGTQVPGLDALRDLDLGFTPATNLPHLRRLDLPPGEGADLPVAWFDLDGGGLTELPQRYHRLDRTRYQYDAPTVPYSAVLQVAESGFVAEYPGLWTLER